MKSKLSTAKMSEKAKNNIPLVRPANGRNYRERSKNLILACCGLWGTFVQ